MPEKEYKTTVLPREDTQQPGSVPGIHVPENAHEIKEFSEVNQTSAKELNAQIAAEQKAKEKKA